jgi:mono/diheme cytochrome c family protein
MRILKRLMLSLVALVAAAAATLFLVSNSRMNARIDISDPAPVVHSDSATVARGSYLVRAIGKCVDCHDNDLGGKLAVDAGPIGQMWAPNLTSGSGGMATSLTDADIIRSIRHGVGREGRKLLFMPSAVWPDMADDDVTAIVAYLRSIPAVDRTVPAPVVKPLGRVLYLAGQLPMYEAELIDHDGPFHRVKPAAGPNAEYGKYLATIGGCVGCHGPGLSGGHVAGTPPEFKDAANITPTGIGHYSEADFFRAMREGKRPDGTTIDPFMPIAATKLMTDDDTRAIWEFLKGVPRKEFGGH